MFNGGKSRGRKGEFEIQNSNPPRNKAAVWISVRNCTIPSTETRGETLDSRAWTSEHTRSWHLRILQHSKFDRREEGDECAAGLGSRFWVLILHWIRWVLRTMIVGEEEEQYGSGRLGVLVFLEIFNREWVSQIVIVMGSISKLFC